MPLFFIAAGWVFKERGILSCVKHRFRTIIVPYFSFGIVILAYWWLVERRFRDIDMTFLEAFIGLFRGQFEYLGFNVHLWFLPCFFLTVIIFNALWRSTNKGVTYFIVVVMSAVYVFEVLPSLPWGADRVFKYIGFYAIGKVLASISTTERMKSLGYDLVSLLLLEGVLMMSLYGYTYGIFWFITGTMGTISIMIVSAPKHSNIFTERFLLEPLQFLGRISLVILCCHGPIYRIVIKVLSMLVHINTEGVRTNIALVVVVVCITVLLCSLVYWASMSYAPWIVGKQAKPKGKIF